MELLSRHGIDEKSAMVVIETLRAAERELSHMAQGNGESNYAHIANQIARVVRDKIDTIVRDYRKLAVAMYNCNEPQPGNTDGTGKWSACHYYGERALVNIALYYAAEDTDNAIVALTEVERALKSASDKHSVHLDATLASNLANEPIKDVTNEYASVTR